MHPIQAVRHTAPVQRVEQGTHFAYGFYRFYRNHPMAFMIAGATAFAAGLFRWRRTRRKQRKASRKD